MPEATHTCPSDHSHGANTKCYLHHACRCTECRAGQAARARQRRREQAYGTYTRRMVDAAPAREHLAFLRSNGMGIHFISAACGVPAVTLSGIVWGRHRRTDGALVPPKRVRQSTEAAILAVRPKLELLADHAIIDARGVRRRLQALCRCGWSMQAISRHAGVTEYRFQRLLHADQVLASTARLVVSIYEQLWDTQPPHQTPTQRAMAARARAHAKKNRWVGPLAWDDIDTDNAPVPARRSKLADVTDEETPAAKPLEPVDEIAVDLAVQGHRVRLTPAERRACIPRLHAKYYSDGLIADTIGCSSRTVERIREELGLPAHDQADLIDRSTAA